MIVIFHKKNESIIPALFERSQCKTEEQFSTLSGKAIQESPLINDPISAVVVGMLATVVLQSATTTTNILVTMVAANSDSNKISNVP